jgi:hypothetical protein
MPLNEAMLAELFRVAKERDRVLHLGFTGTRHLDEYGREAIAGTIGGFVGFVAEAGLRMEIVHGGCVGADAFAGQTGLIYSGVHEGGTDVHAVIPADKSRVPVDWRQHCHTYELMPPGSTYRDRNKRIVRRAQMLFAVANYPEHHGKSRRSGTWQTVRIAQEANIPIFTCIQHDE